MVAVAIAGTRYDCHCLADHFIVSVTKVSMSELSPRSISYDRDAHGQKKNEDITLFSRMSLFLSAGPEINQGPCKYSPLHMSYKQLLTRAQGTHDATTPSTSTTTHNKGWRFATESPWTLWHTGGSRQGHPRYTGAQTGKAVGGPQQPPRRLRQTTTRHRQVSRQTCFQRNQVLTHLETYPSVRKHRRGQ